MVILAELLGIGWSTSIAGRKVRLSPLTLADWADLECSALADRATNLACWLGQSASPSAKAVVILASIFDRWRGRDEVGLDELWGWLHTRAGRQRWLWLTLRHAEPGLTLATASELVDDLPAADWRRLTRETRRHLETALATFGSAQATGTAARAIDWSSVARHLAATSGLAPSSLAGLTLLQLATLAADYLPGPATELVDPADGRARRQRYVERRAAWVTALLSAGAGPEALVPGELAAAARAAEQPRRGTT